VGGGLGDRLAVGPVVGVVAPVADDLGPNEFGVLAVGELVREGRDPLPGRVRRGEHDPVPVTLVVAVQTRREVAGLDGDALLDTPALEVVGECLGASAGAGRPSSGSGSPSVWEMSKTCPTPNPMRCSSRARCAGSRGGRTRSPVAGSTQ
jgi:hypothetical protein